MITAGELLLALTIAASPPVHSVSIVKDPQRLMFEARSALESGEIATAEAALASLRELLDSDPRWDPDGSIAGRNLPALEARVRRVEDAVERLDALAERLRQPIERPPPADGLEDVSPLLQAAVDRMALRRSELDRITGELPRGAEQCAVLQSSSFARASDETRESEALVSVVDTAQERIAALEESERIKALKARLDSTKRQVIATSEEKELLAVELNEARTRQRAYRRALIDFIASAPPEVEPGDLGTVLNNQVRDRWIEVGSLNKQSALEKALSLEQIDRLRFANDLLSAEGARDLTRRIEALADAVEHLPVSDGDVFDPSMGWFNCCMSVCRE